MGDLAQTSRPRPSAATRLLFISGYSRAALHAGATGLDAVELFLAPNRGEKMDKLSVIASGGEISRVMLALKSVLGSKRGTATMLFDEIDMGVGGRVASKVASVLAALAEDRQVICITHLAAIASRAQLHLKVEKREEDGRTVSQVEPIIEEQRVAEIARMLGGESGEGRVDPEEVEELAVP